MLPSNSGWLLPTRLSSSTTSTTIYVPLCKHSLPLLHGQFKSLGRIFCEECRHLPGKLCAVDRDIDFIGPHQPQAIEIARSDR
jgi:hypothetical protein